MKNHVLYYKCNKERLRIPGSFPGIYAIEKEAVFVF